jgi:hypothetical protein
MVRGATAKRVRLDARRVVVCLAVAVLGLQACIMPSGGHANMGAKSGRVRLGSGRLGRFRWMADTYRSDGRHGVSSPCLHVELERAHRYPSQNPLEISVESTNCSSLSPTPDLVSLVDEIGEPKMTVLVMAFPPKVHGVTLYFNGHVADRTVQLRLLSSRKASKAHLDPFRYGTFAFTGNSCVSRFVAHSRAGRVVYDGGRMKCRVRS